MKKVIIISLLCFVFVCVAALPTARQMLFPGLVAATDATLMHKLMAPYHASSARADTAINQAITDANINGNSVTLTEGTFNLRASIKPMRGTTFTGQGQRTVIKKPTALRSLLTVDAVSTDTHVHVADSNGFQANDEVYLAANNKTDFSAEYYIITSVVGNIVNLTPNVDDTYDIDTQSAVLSNEFPAIRVGKTGLGNYNRSDVEIKTIKIDGNFANRASDNAFAYRNSLIEIEASSAAETNNVRITDVQLYNATACSIYSHYAKKVFIHGLIANNTKGKANWGIQIGGASRDVVVENCHEVDSNYGFYVCEQVNNLSVTDLSCGSNDTSALLIGLNNGPITFIGCNFYDYDKVGMTAAQAGSFGTLIGCNFTPLASSAYPGFNITSTSYFTFIGCRGVKGTAYADTNLMNISSSNNIGIGWYLRHKHTGAANTSAAVYYAVGADKNTLIGSRIIDGDGNDVNDLGANNLILTPAAGVTLNNVVD